MGSKVRIDSRLIEPGDTFVAIRGGVNYVEDAMRRGAELCVVPESANLNGEKILTVPDTIGYLGEIAKKKRKKFKGVVIGITGSAGKTTCKEMLVYALKRQGIKVSFSKGNYNNMIGLPISILEADLTSEFWILELGTSYPGEIAKLVDIAYPDVSIITSIYPSHLEGLGTIPEVAREKSEISTSAKVTIVPIRFYWYIKEYLSGRHVVWSEVQENKFPIPGAQFDDLVGVIKELGRTLKIDLTNVDWSEFNLPPGRFNILKTGSRIIIDDSYNANPGSMKASLSSLSQMNLAYPVGFVLGDMLELGSQALEYHKDIVAFLRFLFPNARKVFVGQLFCKAARLEKEEAALTLTDWRGQESRIINFLEDCSTLFLKASHSIGLGDLVKTFSLVGG